MGVKPGAALRKTSPYEDEALRHRATHRVLKGNKNKKVGETCGKIMKEFHPHSEHDLIKNTAQYCLDFLIKKYVYSFDLEDKRQK